MPHTLVLGQTTGGKTHYVKQYCKHHRKKHPNKNIVLFDPVGDPDFLPLVDFSTDDHAKFNAMLEKNRGCLVIIDEASAFFQENKKYEKWAMRGRHYGHKLIMISQRSVAQISPSVRGQIHSLVLFKVLQADLKIIKGEWDHPELETADKLKKYEFMRLGRFEEDSFFRGKLDE